MFTNQPHRLTQERGIVLTNTVSAPREVTLRLTVQIHGQPYYLIVTPESFKLVPKGKRHGIELPWSAFVDEDVAMLSDLHAAMRRSRSAR